MPHIPYQPRRVGVPVPAKKSPASTTGKPPENKPTTEKPKKKAVEDYDWPPKKPRLRGSISMANYQPSNETLNKLLNQ